jgi:hypothetical protein
MPIQVNYYSKVVFITSPTTIVTVQELVDAIRTAEDTPEGISFGGSVATMVNAVIDAEGKAEVGSGVFAGIIMTLKSDWYIEFWDGVTLGIVKDGNVAGGLDDRPVRCAVGSADTALQLGAVGGTLVETGISGLTQAESDALLAIELATDDIPGDVWSEDLTAYTAKGSVGEANRLRTYDGRVSIDVANGEAGTAWPIGTHKYPVKYLADALAIATTLGLDIFWVHGPITIGASDVIDGYQFEGHAGWGPAITFAAGCSANETSYMNIELDGEVSPGDVLLVQSCTIVDLVNFTGVMNVVSFGDNSSLEIDSWATLINCVAGGQPTSEPEINLNDSATTINGWNGNIKLKGKTGANRTVLNMMAGNLIIDSSCEAGSIQLLGVGYLEADNSGVGCTLDDEGFISVANISFGVWEEMVDDHGSPDTTGKKLKDISSGVILTGLAAGSGTGNNQIELPAAASNVDGAYDPAMIVIVAGTGAGQCRGIYQYEGGSARTATVDRNWKVLPDVDSEFVITAWPGREHVNEGLADGGTVSTITLNPLASGDDDIYIGQSVFIRSGKGEDQVATITAYDGDSKIASITPDWKVIPDTTSGYVMLPFRYLTAAQTAKAIWDAAKASHNIVDTMGEAINDLPDDPASQLAVEVAIEASETAIRGTDGDDLKTLSDQLDLTAVDLDFIKSIEGGRWKIIDNQMVFYKDDNTTEVARFNLFDAGGAPAEEDVFERTRV